MGFLSVFTRLHFCLNVKKSLGFFDLTHRLSYLINRFQIYRVASFRKSLRQQ